MSIMPHIILVLNSHNNSQRTFPKQKPTLANLTEKETSESIIGVTSISADHTGHECSKKAKADGKLVRSTNPACKRKQKPQPESMQ